MAYQEGVATSQDDFIDKLTVFARDNAGFTLDEFSSSSNKAAVHKGNLFVQFRWNDDSSGIALFQSLGFSGGTAPGSQTGDSGNGDEAGTVTTERRISDIGNGPYVKHYFFGDSAQPYVHCALEYATGKFRHLSFGLLIKKGVWTGGEYVTGHVWEIGSGLTDVDHYFLADLRATAPGDAITVHIEPTFPDVGASVKWGVMANTATPGTDKAGNARVRLGGGFRDFWLANALDGMPVNPNNGFIPMWPGLVFLFHDDASIDRWRYLGQLPDIRVMNGKFLDTAEELVVGADTWKVFPWVRKATTGEHSGNMFVAYKKVA